MDLRSATKPKYYSYFFALVLLTIIMITTNYLTKKDQYIQNYLDKEKLAYEAIVDFHLETATIIYKQVIYKPLVIDILKMAQNSDERTRDQLRNKLYKLLLADYNRIQIRGVRHVHFHFPNGESFLRMHRPEKYGDNLVGFRYSVERANADLVIATGFEEGRIYNAFRHVFPIIIEGIHLGSVEISMSNDSFTGKMDHLFNSHHIFALKKSVVQKKVLESEHGNYKASDFSEEYLYESTYYPEDLSHKLLGILRSEVAEDLPKGLPFVTAKKYSDEYYLISFLPIHNVEGDHVAYLITYDPDDTLHKYFITYLIFLMSVSTLLFIIFMLGLQYLQKVRTLTSAQSNIASSKEDFRLLSEHAHNWEYWIKPDGTYKYISPACKNVCGYSNEALENNPALLIDIVLDPFKEVVKSHLRADSLADDEHHLIEFSILTKDGRTKWIEHNCHPIYSGSGEFIGRRGINRDVTEKKNAYKKLLDRENKISSIFKSAPVGIGVVRDRVFQEVNDRFCEMTGYSAEELIGQNARILYPTQEEYEWVGKEKYRQIQKNGTGSVETRFKKKNDDLIKVVLSSTPLNANNLAEGVTFSALDITEKDKLAEQLQQSQKLETVGTMVGGISHELNNILQSMFLYGGLVQEDLPENEELLANFDHMLSDGERAKNIVKQILTFSRKNSVEMQPHAIHELVIKALLLERAALPANIEIKQDIDTNCGTILCDETQIHQIIINLCNNAQHAMSDAGGMLTVSLKQANASLNYGDPKIDVVALKVSDTGHGIETADLEKVFDPFFTTKQFGKGTGLGLSVIHGIVEMMGGQITVTSEFGKGTTFQILFPVVGMDETSKTSSKPVKQIDDIKKTILLVDDDDSIRIATQTILTRKGFTVTSAADGKLALDLFKANPDEFDIIVTDQSMPKMSGSDLVREIRKTKSNIPIILSTGQLGAEDQKDFNEAGITGFIQKPWTAEELIGRIQQIVKK